jgi:hypothetical protein
MLLLRIVKVMKKINELNADEIAPEIPEIDYKEACVLSDKISERLDRIEELIKKVLELKRNENK